ncbi:MAG TPA: PKD domain-containing protein, partial [Puia sp.]|nr:PKD domain-containing protein [Puia sp.]
DGTTVQTTTLTPVQHSYSDTGYQNVILTVYHKGCKVSDTVKKYIYVNPPVAGFSYKINCGNRRMVTFTDTSEIDITKGAPTYQWNFGDGSPVDNTPNPVHTFPSATGPPYTVTETVTNGSCSDTRTTVIDLASIIPSFTVPDSVCKNANFTMTSTSTPASAIQFYSWQVGAVGTPLKDSSLASRTISLPNTANYVISLVVTDSGGCTFTAPSKTVHITGPKAAFTPATGGCRNNPILFTDQSTVYPGYPIVSWTLDGGDSTAVTKFTAPPITHSYADTGTYISTLIVTDSKGCTDTATAVTPVKITAPRAGFFAADTLYCPNAALPFTDSSQGNNLLYSWDFGDGSPNGATPNPSHAYTTDGKYYSVKLKITDGTGCSDSVTRTNYIHIQSPIAAFTMQDSTGICIPLATTFLPAGQYYDSLYWDFGDGTTSTLDTTTHFYSSFNTFTATLNLKGAGGCISSTSRNIYIYNPATTASFTNDKTSGCDSFLVNFQINPPPYTRFTLAFGDGAADSSNNKTPSHEYTFPSTYVPVLNLQDSSGCIVVIKSSTGSVTVYGAIPFFNMNEKKFCDVGNVFFTDITITNDKPVVMAWDFGDGGTATGTVGAPDENPSHVYPAPGIFYPKLTLNTSHGCNESYTDTVHVYQTPHPLITLPSPSCVNALLQFQGSLVTPDLIDTVNWAWNFGNGQTSSDQNPQVTYPQAGPYTVSLRTFVSFGCSDTISQPLTINPLPVIKGPKEITTPVGLPVTIPFTYSSDVISYAWSPETNLSCTDCPNPVASPIFNTLYRITVTDSNSCVSSDSILVKTICNGKNYFIPNTFSPNNDGVNDAFYPRGNSLYNIQSMRIFNRWGQMVFERRNFPANSASDGWDGTYNNRPAPSDAYVYIIEVICENAQVIAIKGDVTLIR